MGFIYIIYNESETVPIAYKSHVYSNAESRFAQVEKVLTAVQTATTTKLQTDVDFVYESILRTQDILQYEEKQTDSCNILPIEEYNNLIYTDGSAQPVVGKKQNYSAACAVVVGEMHDGTFVPQHTYTRTLGNSTAQLAEL